jgi:hypothetical protein
MSQSIILYASHKCLTSDSQPIRVGKSVIWIRVEDVGEDTLLEALNKANPFPEEIVLNTINKTVMKETTSLKKRNR